MLTFDPAVLPSAAPSARRSVTLYGGTVELWWLPDRAQRRRAARTPLLVDRAPQIIAQEALGHSDDPPAALTPNRYPFAKSAGILWSTRPQREANAALLELAFALVEPSGGTAMMNTVGAAATQARAHVHLVGERMPFLATLKTLAFDAKALGDGAVEAWGEVDFVQLAPPFPGLVLGVRGERAARAGATARLLALRTAPAANVISDGTTTWFVPRGVETPAPHFPLPLGCAELSGRFCYEDEAAFAKADAGTLHAALTAALWSAS